MWMACHTQEEIAERKGMTKQAVGLICQEMADLPKLDKSDQAAAMRPHHYHFQLLALSTALLPVPKDPSCRDVEREARKHLIGEASLVGLYER
jgi:hypothetical protein